MTKLRFCVCATIYAIACGFVVLLIASNPAPLTTLLDVPAHRQMDQVATGKLAVILPVSIWLVALAWGWFKNWEHVKQLWASVNNEKRTNR